MDLATADHLLTTTRSVRKRLDFAKPVDLAVVGRCLEIAFQAPTGSNAQGWHFVVVTDADKRRGVADLYRRAFELYANNPDLRPTFGDDDLRMKQLPRVVDSAMHLAEHMHEAPVLVIPCIEGRVENAGTLAQASVYGSILPAAWSFMLAADARARRGVDHAAHHVRAGRREAPRPAGSCDPDRALPSGALHRERLQAGQAHPVGAARALELVGDAPGLT